MAKAKKAAKKATTKPVKDIKVKTDLSFEQLLNMAANTPIKKNKI